jgi:hypothetical protein
MPARLRFVFVLLLIVACQLGLVLGALWLCDLRTERDILLPFPGWRRSPAEPIRQYWVEYRFRGYPVPWSGSWALCHGTSPGDAERIEYPGRNLAVPACLLALALVVPLVGATELRRRWCYLWSPRSRGLCYLWVIVFAAVSGLVVALLDITTREDEGFAVAVGAERVPFEHPPGRWVRVPDPRAAPGVTVLVDPPQVEWLRQQRRALFPANNPNLTHRQIEARKWAGRTRRTLLGVVWGLLVAGVWFRPWRRGCPVSAPGTPGTGGTSRPGP